MILVVGLGNPGRAYEGTRHNAGFLVVDQLRDALGFPEWREKFSGVFSKGEAPGPKGADGVALLKPLTFMNVSGDSVQPAAAFLKVEPRAVVVVHDELDLPFGEVRIKVAGGHAGHNGLRSIIQRLGTPDFVRVRVGIGKPPPGFQGAVADYVLGGFDPAERAEWPDVQAKAVAAVRAILTDGATPAMNRWNGAAPMAMTTKTPRAK